MENYGEEKGFDMIIGVTDMGNVLYANEQMDITDIIIKELTFKYSSCIFTFYYLLRRSHVMVIGIYIRYLYICIM